MQISTQTYLASFLGGKILDQLCVYLYKKNMQVSTQTYLASFFRQNIRPIRDAVKNVLADFAR